MTQICRFSVVASGFMIMMTMSSGALAQDTACTVQSSARECYEAGLLQVGKALGEFRSVTEKLKAKIDDQEKTIAQLQEQASKSASEIEQLKSSLENAKKTIDSVDSRQSVTAAPASIVQAVHKSSKQVFAVGGTNAINPVSVCPPGQVMTGIEFVLGGTCNNTCNGDGRPISTFQAECAPLALVR